MHRLETLSSRLCPKRKYYEQSEHKWYKIQHPVLEAYLAKRSEYFEEQAIKKAQDKTDVILNYFDNHIPADLEQYVKTFAPLSQDAFSTVKTLVPELFFEAILKLPVEATREILQREEL